MEADPFSEKERDVRRVGNSSDSALGGFVADAFRAIENVGLGTVVQDVTIIPIEFLIDRVAFWAR